MIINTTRFGRIELNNEDVLTFNEGVLGFVELRQFVLLDDPNDEIFAWLQSCEVPQIAFPVLEPQLFADSVKLNLAKNDLEALKMTETDSAQFFSIITIPDDPTQMTANLKAPVAINIAKKLGRQCVLQDNSLAIREPIFAKLQQRVVMHPQTAIKHQSPAMNVAKKLPQADVSL